MYKSPRYNPKQLSRRQPGRPGRPARRGTCRRKVTGGVTGPSGKAKDISREKWNLTRAGSARGAATIRPPTRERSCHKRPQGTSRHRVRDHFIDKPVKEENDNQNRLDHLQRQLDQLVGQQYGLEHVGAVDPLFTPVIMASPYTARFKMPSMASYDGFTDADEHLENYQAHMLIQNANEASLCKSFGLTLTGAARKWYRRLVPRSISSFKQLADAFAAAYLSSKTRKMEASYLFEVKQGENEPLKEFLDCFDKAVVQIKSCSDDTLIQAFQEGIKDRRLVWTLAYNVPPTFAHLRGIAWKHAEADEYVRGRGMAARGQSRLPGRKSDKNQSDQNRMEKGKAVDTDPRKAEAPSGQRTPAGRFHRARRNQNKYYNFHKDVGHDTKDCIQFRDQIELLIRDGHLREFVDRIKTPASATNRTAPVTQPNPEPSNRPNVSEPEHIVHTIFGGDVTGATASSRRSYACEARWFAHGEYINMAEHVSKICCQDSTPITFTDDEADRLLHPHNDALIEEI
ncbi:hypothetical protein TIFTF001_018843 [Ficus carica]|uniref:Retrotransposon gag domain-containing protein n=1 Tax=Ficus carica TaxID=3494 RepID=A0AA88A593_FICCA|nr:hypothetical protein TIFTF001_018843 [Ficus carica]